MRESAHERHAIISEGDERGSVPCCCHPARWTPSTATATGVGPPCICSVGAGCGKLRRKPDPLYYDRCDGAGPVSSLPSTGPLSRIPRPRAVPRDILVSIAASLAQFHATTLASLLPVPRRPAPRAGGQRRHDDLAIGVLMGLEALGTGGDAGRTTDRRSRGCGVLPQPRRSPLGRPPLATARLDADVAATGAVPPAYLAARGLVAQAGPRAGGAGALQPCPIFVIMSITHDCAVLVPPA